MKAKTNIWLRGLIAAVITGGSSSGLAALGVTVADAAGVNVGALNLKQVGIMFMSGAVVGLLAYLKQSPVPPVADDAPTNPPAKFPLCILLGALSVSLLASGCATNKYRVVFNAVDTTDSAVTAAERVFARYQVRQAKAALIAEGNPAPSALQIEERAAASLAVRQIEALDRDYRAAVGALIQAVSTAQALEAAGGKALIDPVYQTKVVTAANAIIRAIAEITETQLKEVRP